MITSQMHLFNSNGGISSTFLSSFLDKTVCKKFTFHCVFCNVAFVSCSATKLSTEPSSTNLSDSHLENKKAACQFSRQGWCGLPYDHFSLVKNIVRPIKRCERWFFSSQISLFAFWLCLKTEQFFHTVISVDKSQYLQNKKKLRWLCFCRLKTD